MTETYPDNKEIGPQLPENVNEAVQELLELFHSRNG